MEGKGPATLNPTGERSGARFGGRRGRGAIWQPWWEKEGRGQDLRPRPRPRLEKKGRAATDTMAGGGSIGREAGGVSAWQDLRGA
jgi:hypothetical protein